jgi:hypothetical protein
MLIIGGKRIAEGSGFSFLVSRFRFKTVFTTESRRTRRRAKRPVFVNFAISGADRLVRDVLAALSRREKESVLATKAAETELRSELNGAVTGILLSSELALALPSLPVGVVNKLQPVHELALQMRTRLGNVARVRRPTETLNRRSFPFAIAENPASWDNSLSRALFSWNAIPLWQR